MYDTFGKHTKRSRIIEGLSSHQYDKWRKVVVLLREYGIISQKYTQVKEYRWYEIVTYNFKQI